MITLYNTNGKWTKYCKKNDPKAKKKLSPIRRFNLRFCDNNNSNN